MPVQKNKLAIIPLGTQNAGKSNTWYKLFGRKVKAGKYLRPLPFNSEEYAHVFLINSSMEEQNKDIEDNLIECDILLCSVQYNKKGKKTIEYLHNQGYTIYVYWLNPGCREKAAYNDYLKIIEMVQSFSNSKVKTYKAIPDDADTKIRSNEILKDIYQWGTNEHKIRKILNAK